MRDVKLEMDDFGEDDQLNGAVRIYCKLLRAYMSRLRHSAALHRREKYVPLNRG